ncbi:MAG: PHB depolymerase family esterase [Saprospiraceae bacterium]
MPTLRLLSLLLLVYCAASTHAQGQQTLLDTLLHNNISRDYRLYIPAAYTGNAAYPLVFNLHGYGSSAFEQQLYAQMDPVADTAHFIVCYPNGVDKAWNVGWIFGSQADDVDFIGALLDKLIAQYNIDTSRVYSCGMSNGGFMSYRLACELNDRVAAVASVTGSMVPVYAPTCQPGRSVPVMEIHGTADPVVPYNGQIGVSLPVDTVVQYWVNQNGCNQSPVATVVPNLDPTDGCTAVRFDYGACDQDRPVSFYKITGGGHTWPGAPINIGVTCQDFDASVEIWRFFNRFRLPVSTGVEQATNGRVAVFPNPVSDVLHLRLPEGSTQAAYVVYNNIGVQCAQGLLTGTQPVVPVQALPAGAYYLRIQGASADVVARFLKSN